jgi:diadenosine tetraphosphate (Ap4A) HIT family hydrolase
MNPPRLFPSVPDPRTVDSMTDPCPFCLLEDRPVVLRNELAIAFFDKYPVSPGHLLVIPIRHVASWFDATPEEKRALDDLIARGKDLLDAEHHPDGYNLGVNVGAAAGQTIFHLHVHLIPRFSGDTPNPRGGVRGVIPGRQGY